MTDRPPQPTPDHRARRYHLAIVFSDLSDSTTLASTVEAEHYADLLAELRQAYQDVIPKHGGTIVRIQGDGMLAIFGYPDAQEDAGRRATEAALELHALVRELRLEPSSLRHVVLSLHTGIHSGLVLLDDGDVFRGRFDLLGNPPNVAARICEAARRDEILVSEGTLGAESHFFRIGARRLLTLKGVAAPVAVHHVVERAAIRTRFEARVRRGLTPFVGRAAELAQLETALDAVAANVPRFVAIAAPAGVGKTRFAEEFLGRVAARGLPVHRGYCESYLSAEPLQPFVQMLRALFGLERDRTAVAQVQALERGLESLSPELATWRADLLHALSLPADGTGDVRSADGMTLALRALFDRLAAAGPLVLFIDDWQWADAATRHAVSAVRSLARPILVLVATRGSRAGDADMNDATVVELTPFTDAEAAEAINQLRPGLDPFLADKIQRHAGGNALFIEELCHAAAHDASERGLTGVPAGAAVLDTLIESRVARLPAEHAAVVRAAAVIGNVVPAWLLERVIGYPETHPVIAALAQHDLIFPGEVAGTLRFKHGLTRDAIYERVGLHERRAMHLRIAEALRAHTASGTDHQLWELLAYHYSSAGQPADAARFAELAGDKAMAASALDRAQVHYRTALDALDVLPLTSETDRRWSAIVQRLGTACVFDPARDQLDLLRRAVARATARNDQAAIARAEYWLGYVTYALGESRAAIAHSERALVASQRAGDGALTVEIEAMLGQARAAACDYAGALELLEAAITVKSKERTGTRRAAGLAYSLACKASVLGDRGRFADALACFEEALHALHGAQHEVEGSVLCWRSAVHLWRGDWGNARADAVAAQHVAQRTKTLYVFAMGRALAAYSDWVLARSPQALHDLGVATSWLEARDKGLFISLNYGWLTDGLATLARFAEARRSAARALQRTRKLDRLGEAMTYRALARMAAAGHGRRPPHHYLALAMRSAAERGAPHEVAVTQLCQAELALARHDRATALALLDDAGAAFATMGMTWHLAEVARRRASA